ncbi:MAG: hypothetical protein ACFBSE_24990 [Prochloraceae cyanobacterium]
MSNNSFEQQRLQDLADNIARSQKLLKEFEEALEYASDPRIKAKYKEDIKRQKDAIDKYQREYSELKTPENKFRSTSKPSNNNLKKCNIIEKRLEK